MQVNAINQFRNVQFEGKKDKKAETTPQQHSMEAPAPKRGFMSKLTGPVAAALFMLPVATSSLTSCEKDVWAYADADAIVNYNPGDSCDCGDDHGCNCDPNDGCNCDPNDGCNCEPADTVIIRDTIYIPPAFQFPTEIQDSLNIWRGDILDVPVEGDDGDLKNKALLHIRGLRDWDYKRPEYMTLNLEKSDDTEARYDHVIADSIKNDIRVTLVKPGEITVVKKDGTVTDDVSGLMFNEDGYKTFAHSNGKNMIFVYPKAMEGPNRGKFVELGTMEPGYLPEDGGTPNTQYGKNVLLYNILGEGTEDHFVNVEGQVMSVDELRAKAEEQIIIEK